MVTPLQHGCLMWDIAGEYRTFLMIPSTLLMQVMHPMVGAAVEQQSVLRDDPWGRAGRTSDSVLRYVYGGDLAIEEAQRLRRLHASISGVDARGRPYHALNGAAYAWVNAVVFERYVAARRMFGAPLNPAQQEELYRDARRLGAVLGVPEREMPTTLTGFWDYYAGVVRDRLEANAAGRTVLDEIRRPQRPPVLPAWAAPLWALPRPVLGGIGYFLTVGTLPVAVRELLGLEWSARDERVLGRLAAGIRATFRVLPESARYVPAVARIRRRAVSGPRRPG
jgi:uncharacterized protein (DUF2236 family)